MKAEALPRSGTSLSPGLLTVSHLLAQDLLIRLFWTGGLIFFFFKFKYSCFEGFLGGSDDKKSAFNAGDPGSISGWGRSPGEGNGNPPQYSCLENSMDRGAWRATLHGVAKSQTAEKLTHTNTYVLYEIV